VTRLSTELSAPGRFGGSVSFGPLSDDFGPSRVLGDQTAAERGKDRSEEYLGGAFAEVARFDLAPQA
jgi:creatinine amidohydrolase